MKTETDLSKYETQYIDSPKKLVLTPTAGREKPLIERIIIKTIDSIKSFFKNLSLAIKQIIKEIM